MAVAGACVVTGPVLVGAVPAVADTYECEDSEAHWCLEQREQDTPPAPAEDTATRQGGDATTAPPCGWVTVPAERIPSANSTRPAVFTNGRPPEGLDVIWQGWCYREPTIGSDFRGPFRWLPVEEADPPAIPTAEEVAAEAYEAVRGRVPEPVVATSPPLGVDAVVDVPVFVTVTNWEDEIVETRPLLDDTVTVTATPELVIHPAEQGVESVACHGAGRPYDPTGDDLWAQAAAPGACTYAYQHRTGVDRRPDLWPSTVVVRWSIAWSSTSGETGVFPAVEQTVSVSRGVTEVQAVLVEEG
jgi:hypothetical protein